MGIIDWNLVLTSLATIAAICSAFAALKTYKISESLSRTCNIFITSGLDEITVTATSESERVFVLDISILVKERFFKRSNYSCTLLKNVHVHHEKGKVVTGYSILYLKEVWLRVNRTVFLYLNCLKLLKTT
ncbi:hypothetical protein [Vibrio aestuarianus]|uniref:Uncharacterized protein n=1 Tax=Vibrio aestuarianus TaxID=28171 RepID=A0ABD7YQL7_9VIBR|nr:hypothetical protein [Vibrio aestuarianus]WGK87323.1 hypothetical protein PYE67_14460 [Vibrio aestuarianus]WGK87389.1 hypothetical protein PYE67_14820 [Vibrio aestuarianus]